MNKGDVVNVMTIIYLVLIAIIMIFGAISQLFLP